MSGRGIFVREGRSTHGRRGHGEPGGLGSSNNTTTTTTVVDGRGVRVTTFSASKPEEGGVRVFNYEISDDHVERATSDRLESLDLRSDFQRVLTVRNLDPKISENTKNHHTNKFAICSPANPNRQLVVRRGQPFSLVVEFTRPYDQRTDDLKLIFEAGYNPLASKRTYVEFVLSDEDRPREFGARILSRRGNSLQIEVFTPPTCFVAKWILKIDVIKQDNRDFKVFRYVHKHPIYILFNPWLPDDSVYFPETDQLDEYVLNETGRIYNGTKSSIAAKPWNYGQFESCVLDVALYLLDITELNWAVRGNPIPIVRKLSALINSSDDGGILTGRWVEDYSGGTPPLAWTGSVAIIEEYWRTKRPVNYGQCWVFAGIATTLCRALGIPARTVTNYASAHDTDGSITIDYHLTQDDEMDEHNNNDSVWNFHVWTEAWMARPDLPPGYGGWQVIDATPQETSDGIFCCGPTSVVAIQQGEVNLPYDGPFVFAEVNADTVYWQPNKFGVMQCLYIDKKVIGKCISTKSPQSNEREDITWHYKYPDESAEERAAVLKANQVGTAGHQIYQPKAHDVKFHIEQDPEASWLGGSFQVGLRMRNESGQLRTVSGRIAVSSMYYTGVSGGKLKSEPFLDLKLQPGEEKVFSVEVTQDEYEERLKEGYMLNVSFMAHVKETNQNFTKREDFRLHKPHLTARAPSEGVVEEELTVHVTFVNPLKTSLTSCSVTVDGVAHRATFRQPTVPPFGTFTASLPVVPEKEGHDEIIIIFNSKQLEDINTSCPIFVREA